MTTYLDEAIGIVSLVLAGAMHRSNIDDTCNLLFEIVLTHCAVMALANQPQYM